MNRQVRVQRMEAQMTEGKGSEQEKQQARKMRVQNLLLPVSGSEQSASLHQRCLREENAENVNSDATAASKT